MTISLISLDDWIDDIGFTIQLKGWINYVTGVKLRKDRIFLTSIDTVVHFRVIKFMKSASSICNLLELLCLQECNILQLLKTRFFSWVSYGKKRSTMSSGLVFLTS